MSATSDSEKTAARWMPFQCPTCFALFRLQKGNTGRRGYCPQCRVVLTVPVFGEEYPPVQKQKKIASEAKTIAVARVEDPEEVKSWKDSPVQRKRRYIGESDEGLNWEGKREEGKSYSWMVVWSCALMVAVLSAVGIFLVKNAPSKKGTSAPTVIGGAASAAALEKSLQLPQNTSYLNEEGIDVIKKTVEGYEKFDVVKIENAVKGFVTSGSIQERLSFVRDPERVKPLMEKYYGNEEFEPEGFEELNRGEIRYRGDFFTSFVRIGDFSSGPIAVERFEDGDNFSYRVDWESWVGYCEMSAEDLIRVKPTEPKLLRIILRQGSYYNYEYSDDRVWAAYRLGFRNSDRALLAYARRNSQEGEILAELFRDSEELLYTLKIRYPENARSSDQVEIVELLGQGWIEDITKTEKKDE